MKTFDLIRPPDFSQHSICFEQCSHRDTLLLIVEMLFIWSICWIAAKRIGNMTDMGF